MDKATFHQAAQTAIREGKTTRLTLAQTQASNFISGNTQFDPRTLSRLGGAGMAVFLRTVHEEGIAFSKPSAPIPAAPTKASTSSVATPSGWAHLRIKEPRWWLRAAMRGTFAGLSLIALGATYFALFTH